MVLAETFLALAAAASVVATPTGVLSRSTTYPTAKNPFPPGTLRGLNALAAIHGRYFGTAIESLTQRVNDTKYIYLSTK